MKGELLHPSLTAANDVPPQPCSKKVQRMAGRDTLSLRGEEGGSRGGEEEHWPVVEGTLEEEEGDLEIDSPTLQCPTIHHHHNQGSS